jgi:hypothetical protein
MKTTTSTFGKSRVWNTIPAHNVADARGNSMRARALTVVVVLAGLAAAPTTPAAAQSLPKLDYEFFKMRVEPIFLAKRPSHARCYMCHVESNNTLRLARLPEGARLWTEEQSRSNFDAVSKLVYPGDTETSRLLTHPLAPESGGNIFHSGGRQFASKNDPDWKTLAAWINGATLAAPKK